MIINIFQGNEPVGTSSDVKIIIDVIRAFTTAHVAFKKGVKKVYLVNEVDQAMALKKKDHQLLLAGEVNALPIPEFDFGNSPHGIEQTTLELKGRELVQKTTNGVKAVLNNLDARHILVTGFQSADQIVRYIRSLQNIQSVHLIASHPTGDEDLACAEYIKAKLTGQEVSESAMMDRVRNCEAAQKFYTNPVFDKADIRMAAHIDSEADFVMEVHCPEGDLPFIQKIYLTNDFSEHEVH